MKKRTFTSICTFSVTLAVSLALLTGCGQKTEPAETSSQAVQTTAATSEASAEEGGVLLVSVNPEIEVQYDKAGLVTGVTARNEDALPILSSCKGLMGQPARAAVSQLVKAIGEAGYFVEEIEGEKRQITIEIESGSALPYDTFLDEVVADVRQCVNDNRWSSPVDVQGESDYGITDYVDTDYGPDNDGATDYNDTDYGANNDGVTDYNNADDDGAANYDDTDYGANNDGVTNYDDTDYGPNNDGVTDYNDGNTNYDDGGDNASDYQDDGNSQDDGGDSGYDNGESGDTDYDN